MEGFLYRFTNPWAISKHIFASSVGIVNDSTVNMLPRALLVFLTSFGLSVISGLDHWTGLLDWIIFINFYIAIHCVLWLVTYKCKHVRLIVYTASIHEYISCLIKYRTVKNFGGEKTLANLANHNNSPTFFCQFSLTGSNVLGNVSIDYDVRCA